MKIAFCRVATVLVLLAGAACSTPSSRISGHQSAFDTWPAEVQEKIRAGHIDVGFTLDMVQVALGSPDLRSTRTTAQGTAEVWGYFDHGPKFSIGVGMGTSHGSTAYGGGVVVGDNGFAPNEKLRVIFERDQVVAIETNAQR